MGRHVLLVEPHFGGSHRAWAEGLRRHSSHDVHLVTHEAAFWRWRTRGSALTLARAVEAHVHEHGRPDVLLVSTMVDLPALLGLTRRSLGDVPVVHDVHENQLTYPLAPGQRREPDLVLTGWLGLVAADRLVFHSRFHHDELLAALPGFLGAFPDHRHGGEVDAVAAKSVVLPVGIEVDAFASEERRQHADDEAPLLLWNHRWEHDKDPALLAEAIERLDDQGVAFRLALAGARTPSVPEPFARLADRLGERLEAFGDVDAADYPALLGRSEVVVSTARHEFFGLAVCEAMAAGCAPVLPRALSYPELLPPGLAEPCCYPPGDLTALVHALAQLLDQPEVRRRQGRRVAEHVRRFDWSSVAPRYDRLLDEVVT